MPKRNGYLLPMRGWKHAKTLVPGRPIAPVIRQTNLAEQLEDGTME
jgi:hypothetical protein